MTEQLTKSQQSFLFRFWWNLISSSSLEKNLDKTPEKSVLSVTSGKLEMQHIGWMKNLMNRKVGGISVPRILVLNVRCEFQSNLNLPKEFFSFDFVFFISWIKKETRLNQIYGG